MNAYQRQLLNLVLHAELSIDGISARYTVRDLLLNGCAGLKTLPVAKLEEEVLQRAQDLLSPQEIELFLGDRRALQIWVEDQKIPDYLPE